MEGKRIAIIDKDGDKLLDVVESSTTPGVFGIVALNPDGSTITWGGGGGGGHVIQEEGVSLTQRAKLNFVGAGVTATDDAWNDATVVTIPSVDVSGLVPQTRTITINGTTYDLSADRSWTVSGGGGGWTANHETITSTGQTVFNLGFTYVPGDKWLTVYVNGLLQTIGTHYTETGVSQVTFASTVTTGNVVDFQYSAGVGAAWPQWPAGWPVNSVKGTAVLNFSTEDSKATVTVNSALISASTLIGALFVPQETAETSLDDFVNNGVAVTVANIVDNVSFDIIGTASNNATWNYTVSYSLNY